MTKITTEIYLERARKVHGDTYDYSKTVYKSATDKITITCKIHGDFTLRTRNHVDNKQGCKKCSRILSGAKSRKNTQYFIEKSKKCHGDRFDYSKSEYTKSNEKVVVTCKIHGDFNVKPSNFLNQKGCPKCSFLDRGYSRTDFVSRCKRNNSGLGSVYIIKCYDENEVFYKIGIASTNIEDRYDSNQKMPYKYELVEEYSTEPEKAYNAENHVLREMAKYSYQPNIQFKGKTECFSTLEPIIDCLRQYLNVK